MHPGSSKLSGVTGRVWAYGGNGKDGFCSSVGLAITPSNVHPELLLYAKGFGVLLSAFVGRDYENGAIRPVKDAFAHATHKELMHCASSMRTNYDDVYLEFGCLA